ncbi:UDP-galactopyranose mutase [Terrimicrobium sacchariphilum]|uniref:UDP-galactopyranose mutase n=1 Tax=Terrimicrobium sacchariphilum TaxID=690879 RepID=A0A146G2A2_TERSA|nr:UDP-galactopyranose mutase [Terrimicrobium sacchariphilum]GAT31770.1 UDP-galactopyranose mutase [Terrimicrobium sacchariphilum]
MNQPRIEELSNNSPRSHRFLVIGAGFSGAVTARQLAEELPCTIDVIDTRDHIAGNCHTSRDETSGVMVHHYGPHIFNTNSRRVWDYVNRFGVMRPFINRVKAVTSDGVFPLPINLLTINLFFQKTFSPTEAREFVAKLGDPSISEPANFEEQALKMLGRELYEAFFYGYTKKQWGCEPRELPAAVLKRLPVRFNYDDNYYDKEYQGIPENGYSDIVQGILDHPAIKVHLQTRFDPSELASPKYDHYFYTGPIDAFFQYSEGRLGYRTIEFEKIDAEGDYQGAAVLNYPDPAIPWTRMHEHKHFTPWESHERTVVFREFSKETGPLDTPYYPKRLAADKRLLAKYRSLAEALTNVSFLGRLATYRYMDMETVIGEALDFSERFLLAARSGTTPPVFPNDEIS